MIQAPAQSTAILEAIIARIVSELHPRRIYLFGSRARGDARSDSDYDFLVELENAIRDPRSEALRLRRIFDWPGVEVEIHLRNPGQLERRKDDPGTVDWDVVREGRLLHSIPALPILRPDTPSRVKEPEPALPDSVEEWVRFAERDLYHARHHLSDRLENWGDEICFLSQQAAQKILKALIVARRVRPKRTHKLQELLSDIRELGIELDDLDADCLLLSDYAVQPRYPGTHFSRQSARAAIEAAERITAATRRQLP